MARKNYCPYCNSSNCNLGLSDFLGKGKKKDKKIIEKEKNTPKL
jgi:hypothetical protein